MSEITTNPLKQSESSIQKSSVIGDDIDLRELLRVLWSERFMIIGITVMAALISVIYAMLQVNIYRAETTLVPADIEQSSGGLSSQFGGAAAFLGVNLSSGANGISTALEVLKSREFIGGFIDRHNLIVPLFASKIDKSNRLNLIDPEIYDEASGKWLNESDPPTRQDSYRAFRSILSVEGPARDTGLVTVAISWPDPAQASTWVNLLVFDLNNVIRQRDIEEANSAVQYLRQQLVATSLVEMQRVFYQLIESQTRIAMLADVRNEYVFRVIDPAVVPDIKFAPKRSLIAIIGTLVGGVLSFLIVFFRRIVWPNFVT